MPANLRYFRSLKAPGMFTQPWHLTQFMHTHQPTLCGKYLMVVRSRNRGPVQPLMTLTEYRRRALVGGPGRNAWPTDVCPFCLHNAVVGGWLRPVEVRP